jgi:hypothetical protein
MNLLGGHGTGRGPQLCDMRPCSSYGDVNQPAKLHHWDKGLFGIGGNGVVSSCRGYGEALWRLQWSFSIKAAPPL